MKNLTSVERCDSQVSLDDERRCPNRGTKMHVSEGFLSKKKRALWLCDEHYEHGGIKFSPTPYRDIPDESAGAAA